jgi:hypothetical protein
MKKERALSPEISPHLTISEWNGFNEDTLVMLSF